MAPDRSILFIPAQLSGLIASACFRLIPAPNMPDTQERTPRKPSSLFQTPDVGVKWDLGIGWNLGKFCCG